MKDGEKSKKEVETLVRRLLARPSSGNVDDETVRRVTEKVVRALPPYPKSRFAAA
jgi:hypothetical protein